MISPGITRKSRVFSFVADSPTGECSQLRLQEGCFGCFVSSVFGPGTGDGEKLGG